MTTTTLDSTPHVPSKALNIALWIAQSLAGFAFLMAGSMKTTQPTEALAVKMAWVTHFPPLVVRAIGTLEFLGALGLILPSALRILPRLTVFAGAGLAALMLGAAATHVVIGEPQMMVPALVLGSLAAFVAWGRATKAPISAK